jgi:hypothetical protein
MIAKSRDIKREGYGNDPDLHPTNDLVNTYRFFFLNS